MKIDLVFNSTKDYSSFDKGKGFLEIMHSYGLQIDKLGEFEPIRKEFDLEYFQIIWEGRGSTRSKAKSAYILFKGKLNVKHDGIITWHTGLKFGTTTVNGIDVSINIDRKYPLENVIALADKLFEWSEAMYGYITLPSLCTEIGGIQQGVSGLMWVNYFGKPFVKEPEFHVIEEMEHVHHGVRLMLTETPDDIRLKDVHYIKSLKEKIGEGWFWNPLTRRTRLIPEFDRSEMISQED